MKREIKKLDFHARLKQHTFNHALVSTFTFGSSFFEDYALESFQSLENNGNISILMDKDQYRKLADQSMGSVNDFPRYANLRYLLHPIKVPGVYHPKIYFFASKTRGLLIIGSSNLTQAGLGSNAEYVASFDYESGKDEDALALFQEVLSYFEELAHLFPARELSSNINEIYDEVDWLSKDLQGKRSKDLPLFLHNLRKPLLDQILERLPTQVSEISVLSRFFDEEPGLAGRLKEATKARKVSIYTQNRVTTLTRNWLKSTEFQSGALEIKLCEYTDNEHPQQLHGKAYGFECDEKLLLAFGSANCTSMALERTVRNGNAEVLLFYPSLSRKSFNPQSRFDPCGNGKLLRSQNELITAESAPDEECPESPAYCYRIIEAYVDGQNLIVQIGGESEIGPTGLKLAIRGERPKILKVSPPKAGMYDVPIESNLQNKLRVHPCWIWLGKESGSEWEAQSNPVLVANLQDIDSGQDKRRHRQIREARESPQKFMEVLNAICSGEDENRLKEFLTYCDIPLDSSLKLLRLRGRRRTSPTNTEEEMRELGDRNLRHFEVLHEAVIHFVHRHQNRLKRHIKSGTLDGSRNYFHILLTLVNLMKSQITRIIISLESPSGVVWESEKWAEYRKALDAYFLGIRSVLRMTADEYLPAMCDIYKEGDVREAISEEVPYLLEAITDIMDKRDQLIEKVDSNLKIQIQYRGLTKALFFKESISLKRWGPVKREFINIHECLSGWVA